MNMNMKMNKLALASAIVLGGAGFGVNAYAQATGTGTANATVVRPITITASSPNLRFGSFSTSAAGQTVAISTAGARTLVGAIGVGTAQNAFGAASFTVGGEGALTYGITLPSTTNITTGTGLAAETMATSLFTSNPTGTAGLLSGTAGTAGTQTLLVGATITTVAAQVTGIYTGTFAVTVAYN
ncbi:MAG: DUF4402 domain-containing protein [Polaromonas sp.]|uniref:DUF4402 domain-containing protein n=1 Tax=Polaromonas sp. TaxID=1869339 RepID=UPI00272FA978|nr:DUF4402 domain-containing protein [Polaromonas sp.]MDP2258030.1 DUF4402 domain-containing protein [Polaromonas sp.]